MNALRVEIIVGLTSTFLMPAHITLVCRFAIIPLNQRQMSVSNLLKYTFYVGFLLKKLIRTEIR